MSALSFAIRPRVGVNNVRFGMLRQEVRGLMGEPKESFQRFAHLPMEDVYGEYQASFHYDQDDRLEAVELANDAELWIGHQMVSNLTYDALRALVLALDPAALVDASSVRSDTLGIIAGLDGDEVRYESVLAFRDGYWDR